MGAVLRAVAQIFGHRRAIDDFAGVHNAVGIKSAFEFTEKPVDFRAEHLFIPYAADNAVAVFAAQGAAEF